MVRKLVPIAFAVPLLLLADRPGSVFAGEETPAPARVAAWILGDDEADVERAVRALREATPAYLTAVVRNIRALRSGSGMPSAVEEAERRAVLIEARVYSGRRGLAKRLLGEGRMRGCHLLTGGEAEMLGVALREAERAKVLHAPSLVISDRQWGTVKITTPVSYVKSVRVDRSGGDTVRSPVLDIVEEGIVLEVRPRLSEDGASITLAGALTQTAVERPIPERSVQVEDGGTALIEAPSVRESRLDLHFTLPSGDTIAGTGLAHPTDAERELLVLVRAQQVASTAPAVEPPAEDRVRVVTMEVRLLRADRGVLERVLAGKVPDPDEPLCGLEAEDVVRLLGPGRRGAPGVEVLSAPTLTTFDGQRANVSLLNQVSYVKDYEVHENEDGQVLDPVVSTLQDGLVLDLTPRINADRTRIGLETVTTWAVITRPIPDFKTTIAGREVVLQVPELKVSRIAKSFELAAGGYALIGGFDDDAGGRRTCVLLHATVTDLDEEERKLLDR